MKKMRKVMTTIVAAMLMGISAQAQVQPKVLGENHAMIRVEQGAKYLLLPVQEKEENAHIAVLDGRNEMVKRLNVRLAVDKVDYYVPFEIKQAQLLDITFQGDRRTTGAVKDFACWKEMKYSDAFDTTNREKFRPAYHHTPLYGWMNDPNGMFYKDGVWHLYYQYNPYGSQWENMTWGHSTSKDLIHWEAQPQAIEADWLGAIFSGSAIVDKDNTAGFGRNAVIAMYTSAGTAQTQSIAYSADGGQTFTKYAGNPVITYHAPDFRDPKVFRFEERWIVVLAVGQEVQFYSSTNMKDWKLESSFGREYGNHDGVWECPDMLCFGEKWVLLLNINPGGPFGGSATQYFVGTFDGRTFTCEDNPSETKWMDYGKDHYAAVTFHGAPDGRIVALPWMSNWQYANQVPTHQFRSANGLPRDLGLTTVDGETYLTSTPLKEVSALRGKKMKQPTETCEITVDVKGSAHITLSNAKGEEVTMCYDAQKQTFSMDRKKSGDVSFSEAFPCVTTAPTYGSIRQLRLFIDRCSIEAFDGEGKMAMTNLVFPSEPYNNIKVKGNAKFTIYGLQ
jgi:levanase/fructan beta-fructosidase